jgi:hypothetical protein
MSSVSTGAVLRSGLVGALSAFVIACSSAATTAPTAGPVSPAIAITSTASTATPAPTAAPTVDATSRATEPSTAAPAWLGVELTEVTSGEKFTIGGFEGKVVLVENMAQWCSICRQQGDEVKKLHQALGPDSGLVTVSLDIDLAESVTGLRKYVVSRGYDWRFAVATKELGAAMGNLYGPNFLSPSLAPMLIVDKSGGVHPLQTGLKPASLLRKAVDPYLAA